MADIFSGKVYLLVTGASRGIGKQVAETFGQHLNGNSTVLLLSRNTKNLKQTAETLPRGVKISYKSVDFSNTSTEELEGFIRDSLKYENPGSYDRAIIVHAAAMADFYQPAIERTSFEEWHRSFDLNTFSPAVINAIFMKTFSSKSTKKYLVNISSYMGLKPEEFVGPYCASKAAKDMFFKVFAVEHPDVNVVNYLPGFVETDMTYDALNGSQNQEMLAKLKYMLANKKMVTPVQTAQCLVKVLKKQNYMSGDHVDYYKLPAEYFNLHSNL